MAIWERKKPRLQVTTVSPSVAERLEEVADRLEQVASELDAKVEQIQEDRA